MCVNECMRERERESAFQASPTVTSHVRTVVPTGLPAEKIYADKRKYWLLISGSSCQQQEFVRLYYAARMFVQGSPSPSGFSSSSFSCSFITCLYAFLSRVNAICLRGQCQRSSPCSHMIVKTSIRIIQKPRLCLKKDSGQKKTKSFSLMDREPSHDLN